jgi:hypothetical protein
MGMYLTGVHLMGVYLMGVCFMGVYLIGVCLMSVHLIGVYSWAYPRLKWEQITCYRGPLSVKLE